MSLERSDFVTSGRAEHTQLAYAEALHFGSLLSQHCARLVAFHDASVAEACMA